MGAPCTQDFCDSWNYGDQCGQLFNGLHRNFPFTLSIKGLANNSTKNISATIPTVVDRATIISPFLK
jgi:hypothetical protein